MKNTNFKNKIYSSNCNKPSTHNIHSEGSVDKTKQSFKDECDVNQILNRYSVNGSLPPSSNKKQQYGDFTKANFQTTADIIAEFKSSWEALSSEEKGNFRDYEDYAQYWTSEDNLLSEGMEMEDDQLPSDSSEGNEESSEEIKEIPRPNAGS